MWHDPGVPSRHCELLFECDEGRSSFPSKRERILHLAGKQKQLPGCVRGPSCSTQWKDRVMSRSEIAARRVKRQTGVSSGVVLPNSRSLRRMSLISPGEQEPLVSQLQQVLGCAGTSGPAPSESPCEALLGGDSRDSSPSCQIRPVWVRRVQVLSAVHGSWGMESVPASAAGDRHCAATWPGC